MESYCKDIEWVYRVGERVGGMVVAHQGVGRDDQMKEVYRIRAHGHGYVHSSFSSQVASPVESAPLSFPSSSTCHQRVDRDHVPYQ
jgi:hypothetical protein